MHVRLNYRTNLTHEFLVGRKIVVSDHILMVVVEERRSFGTVIPIVLEAADQQTCSWELVHHTQVVQWEVAVMG